MATKAATQQLHDEDFDAQQFPQLREVQDVSEGIDEYAELFAGLDGDSEEKVLLYRIATGSQKQGLLCRLDPGTSVEDIKPRFGGGDYVIKRLRSGMIMRSVRLFVEGEPVIERIAPPPAQAAPQAPALDVAALLQGLQESNRNMLQGIMAAIQPQQSKGDMLRDLMTMKELFAPQQQQQANPMDMFIKGMEMAKELRPPGGGETSGMDVVLEAVKGFAPAISDITQRMSAGQLHQAPQPQQVMLPPPQPEQPIQDETAMLKMYLAMLVQHAKNGKDPSLYADLIADNMTDAQISELLENPDLIGKLGAMNAGVLENRAWFESLIAELKTIMGLTEPELRATVIGTATPENITNANIGSAANADTKFFAGNK